VDTARPQKKRQIQGHLEKGSGEGKMDCGLLVQLEEDGGGGSRHRWMKSSGLWRMLYSE